MKPSSSSSGRLPIALTEKSRRASWKAQLERWTIVVTALLGCSRPAGPPSLGHAKLPSRIAAVVGDDVIDVATVERIAAAQGVAPAVALRRAVGDALFAASAVDRAGEGVARQARRAVLARRLLRALSDDVQRRGPPTDAEVLAATANRWWELDRPVLLRTTHAVVLVRKAEEDKPAKALAARIAARVAESVDPAAFRAAVTAVPADGLEVRVEDLDPVARDRRAMNPSAPPPPGKPVGEYAATYVDAAFAIPSPGRVSPVVRTEFGYHVILLVEMIPEQRVPLEERRRTLEPEIMTRRATALYEETLARTRATDQVEVERSAVDLMLEVKVAR